MPKRLNENDVSNKLMTLGYTLEGPYINSSTPIIIVSVKDGSKYKLTWNKLQQGYRPGSVKVPANRHTQEEVENIFSKEGYTLASKYINSNKDNDLITPSGDSWRCSLSHFMSGRRYTDHVNASQGEQIINAILRENHLEFYSQYRVYIDGKEHLFDFYLPNESLVIEYDGVQHFKPIERFGGKRSYQDRVVKDKQKDDYCSNNGITMVRVPYTISNVHEIYTYIKEFVKCIKVEPKSIDIPTYTDIANYYLNNSLEDTCKHYYISKALVFKSFLWVFKVNKTKFKQKDKCHAAALDFLKGKSQKFIKETYGVGALYAFKTVYGMSKNEYIKLHIYPKAADEYLSGASREYIQEKYHVNAQNAFKYVYSMSIREYRRLN